MDKYSYERTIAITIPLTKISSFENKELGLNHTCIDPSKMSPPNSFMDKLVKRMDNYYSPTNASSRPSSPSFASFTNTFTYNK